MKVSVGQYVKAIHDFQTTERGEITLKKGDILLVSGCVDENWLCGRLGVREGNFPCSFVEVLQVPKVKNGQKLFRASENFPAQVEGDLEFRKGDIILGTQRIDSNWWRGKVGNKEGIFPLTHASSLETLDDIPPENTHDFTRQSSTSSNMEESVTRVEAKALVASTPQLDDELGFQKGDEIWITEVIDSDWYRGECDGRSGMFLSDCVRVVGDLSKLGVTKPPPLKTRSLSRTTGMSFEEKENVPTTYNSPSKQKSSSLDNRNRSASYNSENTRSKDNEVQAYAKTLYPFVSQAPNELTFMDNEIVKLIKHVDSDWIEGEVDGRAGLFPASYVEIIVDCPYDFDDSSDILLQAGKEQSSKDDIPMPNASEPLKVDPENERYGLVLYSFTAESTKDLNLHEGDTIIVLQKIDENWLEAKDESGNIGMCPIQFVEIIGEEPPTISKSSKTNDIKPSKPDEASLPKANGDHVLSCEALSHSSEQHINYVNRSNQSERKTESLTEPIKTHKPSMPSIKPPLKPKPSLAPKPVFASGKYSRSRPNSTELCSSFNMQSLDMMIKEELMKGPEENSRSRSSSLQSSASSGSIITSVPSTDSPPNGVSINQRPKPPKPAPPMKAIPKGSAFHNKAYVNDSGQCSLGLGEPRKSVGFSNFFVDSLTSEFQSDVAAISPPTVDKKLLPLRKPPAPPPRPTLDEPEIYRRPSMRKAPPPRPTGPRVASAPPKTVLTPVVLDPTLSTTQTKVAVSEPISTKPSRPAPPRPAPRTSPPRKSPPRPSPRSPSDLMSFTPNSHGDNMQDSDAVKDLRKRMVEVEKDLEKCIKSRRELEMMLSRVNEDEDKDEIEENLEFYQANIDGLSQELIKIKDDLQELTGETDSRSNDILSLEQQRLAAEARMKEQAEERKRLEEEDFKRREELKQERIKKRQNVIDELLQTEKDYLIYLQLCVEYFLSPGNEKAPVMDMEVLFGNMEEIADVAQKLLTSMEACISGKEFSQQIIGTCFVELAEDMKNAYAPYCRNHDDVHILLEKYEEQPTIQEYVEKILDCMREKVNVFDLGSLLIKPVQRILKYPLLLNELLKTTDEDHPDKTQLMQAINTMTDVATAINEYKRRKDLVFKYKKETDAKFGEKIAKLNLHSLKKKSTRLRARLSTNLGISLQTKDETFHVHEARFRAMEKVVKTFVRDVQIYLEQVQESVILEEAVSADVTDYYEDKNTFPEISKYQTAVNTLATKLFGDFKSSVEELVVVPLNSLVTMFDGPSNVIQKRFDKLLDYDSLYKKIKDVDKSRVAKEALQAAKNDYEAMNAQLLDELPKLHSLSFSLLKDCMGAFVRTRRDFTDQLLNEMYPLLELPMLLSGGENIMETFNIKHVPVLDRISSFSFIPKGFNPRVEPPKVEKRSKRNSLDPSMLRSPTTSPSSQAPAVNKEGPQSPSQKVFIQQKYSSENTYKVIHNYTALNVMDLSVWEGDLVGVMKTSDPMGDKGRWFVDNGETKGFVPRKFLTLFTTPAPRVLDFSDDLLDDTEYVIKEKPLLGEENLLQVDWSASSTPSLPPDDPPPPYPDEYYYAEYAFTARNPNEVSLFEGQVICVQSKEDLDGNTEWWWVDADGHQGFAPAAYLKRMDTAR